MSRRICLVTASLVRHGSGNFILQSMANHWVDSGHEVVVLTFGEGVYPDYEFRDGVEHRAVDIFFPSKSIFSSFTNFFNRLASLRQAIRDIAPDITMVMVEDPVVRITLASLGLGIPVVAISHTDVMRNHLPLKWRVLQQLVYPLSDRIVVLTDKIRLSLPFPMRRIALVIPNPVLPPEKKGIRIDVEKPFIVTAGRMLKLKRHRMLIEVFSTVAQDFPEWKLVILGDGEEREDLDSLVAEKGLEGRVVMPGFTDAVGDWLEAADIFAFPSLYEGFPLALCEAMACGLPSVVSDFPAGPDSVVRNGQNGIIVPLHSPSKFAEALRRLMGDPALREVMGNEARRVVDDFNPEKVLRQWDDLLEEMTGEGA